MAYQSLERINIPEPETLSGRGNGIDGREDSKSQYSMETLRSYPNTSLLSFFSSHAREEGYSAVLRDVVGWEDRIYPHTLSKLTPEQTNRFLSSLAIAMHIVETYDVPLTTKMGLLFSGCMPDFPAQKGNYVEALSSLFHFVPGTVRTLQEEGYEHPRLDQLSMQKKKGVPDVTKEGLINFARATQSASLESFLSWRPETAYKLLRGETPSFTSRREKRVEIEIGDVLQSIVNDVKLLDKMEPSLPLEVKFVFFLNEVISHLKKTHKESDVMRFFHVGSILLHITDEEQKKAWEHFLLLKREPAQETPTGSLI